MSLSLVDILVLLSCGFFIQGPKTIITTTVSVALGEHPSLTAMEEEEEETGEEEEEAGEDEEEAGEEERKKRSKEDESENKDNTKEELNDYTNEGKDSTPTPGSSITLSSKTSLDSAATTTSTALSKGSPSTLSRKPSSLTSSPTLSRKTSSVVLPLKALSTVTAIIDGSGSFGAALGPLLTGVVLPAFGWRGVVSMWIFCNFVAAVPLAVVVMADRRKRETEGREVAAGVGGVTR